MKTIQIAPDLKLPLDTVVQRKAIIAKNRAGKSNTACVYVEEVHRHGVQSIILDPKGDWYGIRSNSSGKGPGLPFLVMGGDHGDVPLDPAAGMALGTYLGSNHVDVVLDVSDFSKAQLARFGADFLEALYDARKKNRTPLNLVLEEAEDFAPQLIEKWTGPDLPRCLGAVNKIAKKAGFLGIGLLLVAQRTASLNKNSLSQCDALFLMRTTAPQDIKAVDDWLQNQDADKRKEVLTHIQGLPTGSAYVWAPEAGVFKHVQLRRRETFDAGFTPKVGESKPEPKVKAMVDLTKLMGEMAAVVEQAKADDPVALKARIREMEAEVRKLRAGAPVAPAKVERVVERVEVSVLTDADRKLLAKAADRAAIDAEKLKQVYVEVDRIAKQAAGAASGVVAAAKVLHVRPSPAEVKVRALPKEVRPMVRQQLAGQGLGVTLHESNSELDGPEQRIVDSLAWLESIGMSGPVDENPVAFLAGYTPNGGAWKNPRGRLNVRGLIEYRDGRIQLTDAGRAKANKPTETLTAEALQARVMDRLDGPMQKILRVLLDAYPREMANEEVAMASGYSAEGGAYKNPRGRLSSLGLIEYRGGVVRAHPRLFLEA